MSGYETITLTTWDDVIDYADKSLVIYPSYLDRAFDSNIPKDSVSKGQLASKSWLIKELNNYIQDDVAGIAVMGCWVGILVQFVFDTFHNKHLSIERMYGFDIDPDIIAVAEKLNRHLLQDSWSFKGVVADVNMMNTANMKFETSGELIHFIPEIVINTSCEHMGNEWFNTANKDQLIIMQTNNFERAHGHINCCQSIEHMQAMYPITTVYSGKMIMPGYTRFMQIGTKS